MATKAELRTRFLAERRALSGQEVTERSLVICDRLFLSDVIPDQVRTIHTFLPIAHQNEVDTWPIIHCFWRNYPSVRVAVSITDLQMNRLAHYLLTPYTTLVPNRWGIPEPTGSHPVPIRSHELDLVLVPLLAFDKRGHRVGYGKGYYDRFLSECRLDCRKVGLSLLEPVERIDNTEPTDIPLDVCLTPASRFSFH